MKLLHLLSHSLHLHLGRLHFRRLVVVGEQFGVERLSEAL